VAVVNTADVPTGDAIRGQLQLAGPGRAVDIINTYTDRSRNVFVDASRIAEGLFASHLAVNVFLLGVAYQGGHIPLSEAAIEEAIRLNGADAARNLAVFHWGRKYFHDAQSVEDVLTRPNRKKPGSPRRSIARASCASIRTTGTRAVRRVRAEGGGSRAGFS